MRGGGLASRAGPMSRAGKPVAGEENRPMTAVRAAGYTTNQRPGTGAGGFDPMRQGNQNRGPAPPLEKRADNSPEDKCREMEKEVNSLIEESSLLSLKREHGPALEKAKEKGGLSLFMFNALSAVNFEEDIEEDRGLLAQAKRMGKGDKMSREQYQALQRKVGGTKSGFFGENIFAKGEYLDRGYVEQAEEAIEREAFEFDKGPDVLGIYLDELQYD